MNNPYQSPTEVADASHETPGVRGIARWLSAATISGGIIWPVLFVIGFNLSMGPYYGPEAPLWFHLAGVLNWVLLVVTELCGVAYFLLRWKIPELFGNKHWQVAIDLACGLVVALPLLLVLLVIALSTP